MENFHQSFQQHHQISLFVMISFYFYNLVTIFLKMKLLIHVDKINAQVCMYSLADQNVIHCTKLAFFDGKLGKFLLIKFLELSFNFFFFCIFKVKVDLTQMRIVISS